MGSGGAAGGFESIQYPLASLLECPGLGLPGTASVLALAVLDVIQMAIIKRESVLRGNPSS